MRGVVRSRKKVSCELLDNEVGIRLVIVESRNDVVAIAPRIFPDGPGFRRGQICIIDQLQPVSPQTLAKKLRTQQPVYNLRESVRAWITDKFLDLLGCRWKAPKV